MSDNDRDSRKFWKRVIGYIDLSIFAISVIIVSKITGFLIVIGKEFSIMWLMDIIPWVIMLSGGALLYKIDKSLNEELDRRLPLFDNNVGDIQRMRNEMYRSDHPDE